jgi:hypothetical protein
MNRFVPKKCLVRLAPLAVLAGFLFCAAPTVGSAKEKWEPIPAEDLAATECKTYPGSSAEILFEKQVMDYSAGDQVITHFRRIKIYSPKGANEEGVFRIEYPSDQKVWSLAARLTKQNGAVTEFTKKEFTESLFAKVGATKVKRQTLAIPDLGAGDVWEMNWMETVDSSVSTFRWWYFQDKMPVRRFLFTLEGSKQDCQLLTFNQPKTERKPGKAKGNVLEILDIPPFLEEPYMPPMRDVRGWFLLLYTDTYMRWYAKDDVWKEISAYWEEEFRLQIKPGAPIKAKAVELLQGAATDEEKLKRLYDFCQQQVTNLDYFDSAELQKAKKKLDDDDGKQDPVQTLSRLTGYSHHLNELFASLAKAAGYDTRLARSASRYSTLAISHPNGWLFIPDDVVAIKLGEAWRFYAPGDFYVPAGMQDQSNESAPCLICDADKIIFQENPVSRADKSPVIRHGEFVLDGEGTLEGTVEISMNGHAGIAAKKTWRTMQQEEIDADYRATITKRLPAAEVGDLQWVNLKGNKLPLIVRYKLKIPAYADVAGTKMILPGNPFVHSAPAFFSSETRLHQIFFDYAWSEHDDIEITLPEGYTLDGGSSPANIGDVTGVLGVRYQMGFKTKSNRLVYKRDFALGGNGAVAFQAVAYPQLKRLFDSINRSDEHTIVLKPKPESPAPASAPAAQPVPPPSPK